MKIIIDDVPFEGQKAIALNGDKAMFYDIVGVKEKEAAQLNRSEPAGVESTSSTDSISQNRENGNTSRKKYVQLFAPRGASELKCSSGVGCSAAGSVRPTRGE